MSGALRPLVGRDQGRQATVLEAAEALIPVLRERLERGRELRRLPSESVADLRGLGLLGVTTPVALGGSDLGVDFLFEVAVVLGRGCGSTAWCGANWAIHNLLLLMFPAKVHSAAFAQGLPVVSTGFSPLRATATPVEGGFLLTGLWDFASGVDHADWIVLLAVASGVPHAFLVRAPDVELLDTWHTTGLRATGSRDVATSELFVPIEQSISMIPVAEGTNEAAALYPEPSLRLPLNSYFGVGVVGSIVGMALGAVEVFAERTSQNVGGLSAVKAGIRPEVHYQLGRSSTEAEAALTVARSVFAEQRQAAEGDFAVSVTDRLRWRRDAAYAGKLATDAVKRIFQIAGAHSIWSDDLLNQYHNDIVAASHHFATAWDGLFSGYGRHLLGIEHQIAMV
jgi:alkylation response protein AidB-like acyl-CoA dehydrogenase